MPAVRWIGIDADSSIATRIRHACQRQEFLPSGRDGFRLHFATSELIDGEYIRKIEYTENFLDPFGSPVSFPIVEYRTCRFSIHWSLGLLEIVDSMRDLRDLINKLSELGGFEIATTDLDVDVMSWVSELSSAGGELTVKAVTLDGIQLAQDTWSRIEIRGSSDVRSFVSRFTGVRGSIVEGASIEISREGLVTSVRLARVGTARIAKRSCITTMEWVRAALHGALRRNPRHRAPG